MIVCMMGLICFLYAVICIEDVAVDFGPTWIFGALTSVEQPQGWYLESLYDDAEITPYLFIL